MPDSRDRWKYTDRQWQALIDAEQPAGEVPGVPADLWAKLTPVEQAQILAQHAGQRAIVQAQDRSGRRVSTTLIVIFVLIPVAIGILWALGAAMSR